MRENPSPVHYRIYIYTNAAPPLGEPTAVSLCPWKRGRNGELTGILSEVDCIYCLQHIKDIGLPHLW